MKYKLATLLLLFFPLISFGQISPYESWRFSVQRYYPGQNFSTYGPPQRYYLNGQVYNGHQTFYQPTKNSSGGSINYINIRPNQNQFGRAVQPFPPKSFLTSPKNAKK